LSSSVQDIASKVGNEDSGLVHDLNEVSSELETAQDDIANINKELEGEGEGEEHVKGLKDRVSDLETEVSTHVADSDIHITAAERVAWNAKQEQVAAGDWISIAEDNKTISVNFTGLILDGGDASD